MITENSIEKTVFVQKRILVFAAFLLLAPLWAPYVQVVNGRRLFLTADSMMFFGGALLIGYLSSLSFPEGMLRLSEYLMRAVKKYWIGLSLLALGLILGGYYLVNQKILHSFMNSADEHSCLFLAECFRMGKWWVEPHALSEFFDVVHVGNRDGKWFSVYPLGWPLIMALGIQWNMMDWTNPILTVLALILFFKVGKKLFGFSATLMGLGLMVITPYFAFTAGSYFSHSTCLLMIALFSYAYLKWGEAKKESHCMLWAGIAALAVGYGLTTRYLTMAAIASPFLIYRFMPVILRREKPRASHYVVVAILSAFMLLIFYQNYVVTGKFYKAPNRYDKSWEKLGFSDEYSALDGIIFVFARSFYLMDWVPPMFLVLFLASQFQKRVMSTDQKLFRYAFFYPVIAYFFYFSWGGNQYGPRYYYEGFPFMALALGDSLRYWWRQDQSRLRKFLLGVLFVSIITNVYQFSKHAEYFDEASSQRKALYDLADKTIDKPSIVFIRGFLGQRLVMSEDDAVRNTPSLSGKILYAHDMGEKNQLLQNYYPDRDYYLGEFDRSAKQAKLVKL